MIDIVGEVVGGGDAITSRSAGFKDSAVALTLRSNSVRPSTAFRLNYHLIVEVNAKGSLRTLTPVVQSLKSMTVYCRFIPRGAVAL